jgi:hypothetical protein
LMLVCRWVHFVLNRLLLFILQFSFEGAVEGGGEQGIRLGGGPGFQAQVHFFKSSAIVANCSSAASKSAVMSGAMISGAGRLVDSSSASSLSQKMSRFTLSRFVNFS